MRIFKLNYMRKMCLYLCMNLSSYLYVCTCVYTETITKSILNDIKELRAVLPKLCHFVIMCHFRCVDTLELKAVEALQAQETLLSLP